jgi:hypothetical protein
MVFLLRMTFWLGLVLVLLPGGAAQRAAPSNEVGASQAISAASATVHDLTGFCGREPDACKIGSELATTMGYRARAGAKMLYELLTEALAPHENRTLAGDPAQSGLGKASLQQASQNTLTRTDLDPAWRGPPVHKIARPSA